MQDKRRKKTEENDVIMLVGLEHNSIADLFFNCDLEITIDRISMFSKKDIHSYIFLIRTYFLWVIFKNFQVLKNRYIFFKLVRHRLF